MTAEERIALAKTKGLGIYISKRAKIERVLLYALVIGMTMLIVGYYSNRAGNESNSHKVAAQTARNAATVACVNRLLGERGPLSAADTLAQEEALGGLSVWIGDVAQLFNTPSTATQAQGAEVLAQFKVATLTLDQVLGKSFQTLSTDAQIKANNPLGLC